MRKQICTLALMMALILVLCACGGEIDSDVTGTDQQKETGNNAASQSEVLENKASGTASAYFSDRDFEVGYDETVSAFIQLNGDSVECSSDAVQINGSTITIIDEGTYIVSGTLNDGMIIIDSEKTDKTQLVLNGVTIHSETKAPVYIKQSDKVFITMAADTTNTLSNGGSFTTIDDNNIDAVIFSKEDVTLNGSGTMIITSPAGHGIVSKDSLTLTSGIYDISSASHGLAGKDDVCITNAELTITSGKDGIHTEDSDNEAGGYIYIQSGKFVIAAEGDGISAAATMQIQDGDFNIVTGGGAQNGENKISDSWGNFMGGGRGPGGGKGGFGGKSNTTTKDTGEDSTSIKGIKSGGGLIIQDGKFFIDSADDSVHSNASILINGGSFEIASGDDGFHADETLTIANGNVVITQSYEGLEGLHIEVAGGDITLTASDDGLNAAGGNDQSGFGGYRGNDRFGGSSNSSGSIMISDGVVNITASGDGIDANGTLEISGGLVTVCGPAQGDTATLDYDISAIITGGTFIGTGGSMMAQTFSDSEQGVIAVSAGNQPAGTAITILDNAGKTMLTYEPKLSFVVVIYSSPDIVSGEMYSLSIGANSGNVTAR